MPATRSPARPSLRAAALTVALLCAWPALSGCTVAGAVLGGVVGLALAGPEGAVAGGEAGLYVGASLDAAIIGSKISEGQRRHEQQVIVVEAPPAERADGWDPAPAYQVEY